jgi:hypothetical protein
MDRLDRIEAQLERLSDEVRGMQVAANISHNEQIETLTEIHKQLNKLNSIPTPPRRRMTAVYVALAVAITLGITAHFRLAGLEVKLEQYAVLPQRTTMQNMQQPFTR